MRAELSEEGTVVATAKAAGFFTRKLKWDGRKGAPDRLFSRKDRGTVFMEMKAPGEEPNALQRREIKRMQDAGMDAVWFDNADDALRYLGLGE